MVLGHALELGATGHWVAAALTALVIATLRGSPHLARWTRLCVDQRGQAFLRDAKGDVEQVRFRPQSLRLGPYLLLVLDGCSGVHRCLFGPDNLKPTELAALMRRLPFRVAPAAAELHSFAPGKNHPGSVP